MVNTGMSNSSSVLTIDKKSEKQYDRQIRLWGVEAQRRIMSAQILVAGLGAIHVELSKNLILAGFQLSLYDSRVVQLDDLPHNFFLQEKDIGKPVAEVLKRQIKEMNTLADVDILNQDNLLSLMKGATKAEFDATFGAYNVICIDAALIELQQLVEFDKHCRESSKCLLISASLGEAAAFFSDFPKRETTVLAEQSGAAATTSVGVKGRGEGLLSFPSLEEFLSADWKDLCTATKKPHPLSIAAFATLSSSVEDRSVLNKAFETVKMHNTTTSLYTAGGARVLDSLHVPFVPVSTVVGGLLCAEVNKAVTHEGTALCNFVVFDSTTCDATIERVPAV
eukprot:Lankesteria_metandrocarpae@DN6169_c0_g1_i1.p1